MFNKAIGLQPLAEVCSCTTVVKVCRFAFFCDLLGQNDIYKQYLDCSTHEVCGETEVGCGYCA